MNDKLARCKILLIDDEPELLALIKELLEEEGFQVFCASSGPEGIHLNEQENPDLIILDLRMPGMDGLETLRHIRESDDNVRVIILTAHASRNFIKDKDISGLKISKFLNKPFDCAELVKVIADTAWREMWPKKN